MVLRVDHLHCLARVRPRPRPSSSCRRSASSTSAGQTAVEKRGRVYKHPLFRLSTDPLSSPVDDDLSDISPEDHLCSQGDSHPNLDGLGSNSFASALAALKRLEKELMSQDFSSYQRLPDSLALEGRADLYRVDEPRPIKIEPKDNPPHLPREIKYRRRVDGLIEPTGRPVLEDLEPPFPQQPIARLAHGLDRVLFNPGVYWLQDPRSRVYNFPTWLENVPSVNEFAFERVGNFVSSSRDADLWSLAKREGRTFAGSTSSLTGMLSHVYFLLSGDRDVNTSNISQHFQYEPKDFTPGQRMPISVILKHNDGVYATDSDKEADLADRNILTWLGTMLEKFLTIPEEQFSRLLYSSDDPLDLTKIPEREAFRFSKSAKFVMRSQLDCQDPRVPGTGVFDIKTRAAFPIRMDVMNHEENSGYLIRKLHGPLESFEKEYYDLIRSAFLKYSFQARIGNMDGVFVAYHNTKRIFGFQYIPLDEMDECLFGATGRGDRVFEKCVPILEAIMTEVIYHFPDQSIKLTMEKQQGEGHLAVFIEPDTWDEAAEGPRPIVELDVSLTNYIDGSEVRGSKAVSSDTGTWAILYSISTPTLSQDEIRTRLAAVKERQFRCFNLPAGLSVEDMEVRWKDLSFDKSKTTHAEFDPSLWRPAQKRIQQLRELAKAGREETERALQDERGRPKIVWGEPEFATSGNDAEEPSEALSTDGEAASEDADEVEGLAVVDAQVTDGDTERAVTEDGALYPEAELLSAEKDEASSSHITRNQTVEEHG